MTIQRYTDGRAYKGYIGVPAVVEHPEGEYVLYADHEREIAIIRAEADFWRNRTIKAEGKNADTTT